MPEINIANFKAVSTTETLDLTIDFDGELHRFRAIVYDSPNHKFLTELLYLDKYEKKLKGSEKRKIRKFLEEYFKTEGK